MFGLAIIALIASSFSAHWAVLVAGSNGFSNYRHQSDICRCYEILIKNGFKAENIITMMVDDIAQNSQNPFKGHIYNVPDGPDVYIGSSKIDYRDRNVTAEKFYAILLGDKAKAGGKVLQSTANDNVFIFYNDHGSGGLICFPFGPDAYADELSRIMKEMNNRKMYKNLVFYVEACYSGSMFKKYLPTDTHVFALTAANDAESSWAEYCGIAKYKTCLSNEYSQRWMEHSSANDLAKITIGEQADHTTAATKRSHVCQFGDMNIRSHKVINYQGGRDASEIMDVIRAVKGDYIRPPTGGESGRWKRVPQSEAHLMYLRTAAESDMFGGEAVAYHQALAEKAREETRREEMTSFFGLGDAEGEFELADDMTLFRRAKEAFEARFGKMGEFAIWDTTILLHRAINEGKLTNNNINEFIALINRMV